MNQTANDAVDVASHDSPEGTMARLRKRLKETKSMIGYYDGEIVKARASITRYALEILDLERSIYALEDHGDD